MEKEIQIPEGVEARIEENSLVVKGKNGELRRNLIGSVKVRKEGSTIKFSSGSERRKSKALVGTMAAHAGNMITGVSQGWEARLKALYSHFPMKLKVEEGKVVIQNFLGERSERYADIVGDTKVEIQKDEITVSGADKEDVGQTAANIETVTKVRGYDRRVFQDGCHLVQKCKPSEGRK